MKNIRVQTIGLHARLRTSRHYLYGRTVGLFRVLRSGRTFARRIIFTRRKIVKYIAVNSYCVERPLSRIFREYENIIILYNANTNFTKMRFALGNSISNESCFVCLEYTNSIFINVWSKKLRDCAIRLKIFRWKPLLKWMWSHR